MGERRSTTRSRDLGTELTRIRKAAGLDAKVLAEKLGWPGSKLSRIEQGKQGIEDIELVALLTVCDALGDNMTRLLTLNRESSQANWLQMFERRPSSHARTLDIEIARGTALTYYAFGLLPGMVQTEGYMRALIRPAEDEAIARRLARQKMLRGPRSMTATFFIEEQVLRRPVGGPAVMHDQLLRLVFLSHWRRVSIRVVPTSAGTHAAVDGGFFLLDNSEDRPIVHLETKIARIWLEDPAKVAVYREAAAELTDVALSEGASREFLTLMADDYGRSLETHD